MNFIDRNYPIGKQLVAPDPDDCNKWHPVVVVNHYIDRRGKTAGIVVETADRRHLNIAGEYLDEDGAGMSESTARPYPKP